MHLEWLCYEPSLGELRNSHSNQFLCSVIQKWHKWFLNQQNWSKAVSLGYSLSHPGHIVQGPAHFWLGWGSLDPVLSISSVWSHAPVWVLFLPGQGPSSSLFLWPGSSSPDRPAFFPRVGWVEATAYLQWSNFFSYYSSLSHLSLPSLIFWLDFHSPWLPGKLLLRKVKFSPCRQTYTPWVISVEQCLLLFSTSLPFLIFPVRCWFSSFWLIRISCISKFWIFIVTVFACILLGNPSLHCLEYSGELTLGLLHPHWNCRHQLVVIYINLHFPLVGRDE